MKVFGSKIHGIVENVAFGGAGVVRQEGYVVFVPGVLQGETIYFRIKEGRRNFGQGELLKVLDPSPDRVKPECPLMLQPRGLGPEPHPFCPGCSYGHVAYTRELAMKQEQLIEVMERIGGFQKLPIANAVASPEELYYRNKIILHTRKDGREAVLGYLGFDNHTVLDIPRCPLAVHPLNELLHQLRGKPGFFDTLKNEMSLTLRWSERDGSVNWRGEANPGDPWMQEKTPAGPMRVPRGSFFQVNSACSALLFNLIHDQIQQIQPARFIDLYCGSGFFSLAAAAAGVKEGIGLDTDPSSIAAAMENARMHGMKGYAFQAGRAEHALDSLLRKESGRRTLLLVDPPRTGLEPDAIRALIAGRPGNILYVSCGADTLARDLARLTQAGYHLNRLQLVDLFPRTPHFETVAWLQAEET